MGSHVIVLWSHCVEISDPAPLQQPRRRWWFVDSSRLVKCCNPGSWLEILSSILADFILFPGLSPCEISARNRRKSGLKKPWIQHRTNSPSSLSPHVWWLCYVILYLKLNPQTIKLSQFDAFGDAQLADMFERFTRIALVPGLPRPVEVLSSVQKLSVEILGIEPNPLEENRKGSSNCLWTFQAFWNPIKPPKIWCLFELICI